MSEFLAEARVLVRPDTTKFRAELVAELTAATRGVTVPVQVVPVAAGTGLAAIQGQALATASALNQVAAAQVAGAEASRRTASAVAQNVQQLNQVEKAALAGAAGMTGLRGAVLTAGTAFLGATIAFQTGVQSIAAAAQLETQLNVFRVTTKATSEEMEAAAENARLLGRDLTLPGVSARDAAEAQLQLARAGLSVQDSMDGTRGALQLATAAQIDFATASNLVAGNLNAFGLAGDQATRVADALAAAANESQISIEDTAIGLRQVAGAANLLGLSLEDTVALLTQLTRAGLAGSDAGTTLRVALVKLANPDVRKEVEKLVGSITDLNGNLDPQKLVEFGEEITESGDKLQQTSRLYELFGENALRVIGLLAQEGVPGFERLSAATAESGVAADTAAARMAGFEGDVENLKNQLQSLQLEVGSLVLGPLSALTRVLADNVGAVNNLITRVRDLKESFSDFIPAAQAQEEVTERTGINFGHLAGEALKLNARMITMTPVLGAATFALDKFNKETEEGAEDASIFEQALSEVQSAIGGLATALGRAANEIEQPGGGGLNVQQIQNRVLGFNEQQVQAQIRGDTESLLAVLRAEQEFLQEQLNRAFVQRREPLRRELQNALLGVVNDIATIQREGAAATQAAVRDATREREAADRELLGLLSQRREDIQRAGEAAEAEGNLARAIRFEDKIQALIKQQIEKIKDQVKTEKLRKAAIRELRIALIESRREEEELQRERLAQAQAAALEGTELDIEFAEITGNTEREISARLRLIQLLKKQQAAVKKGTAEWKRLRNEIAEQQQAIKEARGEAEQGQDEGNRAAEFFFEQLQAQQGFAANLLGNLIPAGQTAGLVGIPSPTQPPTIGTTGVGAGVAAAAAVQAGKQQGNPTAGQANTTNALLQRILQALIDLNRNADTPEAVNNKRAGSAVMDGIGGGYVGSPVM